MHECFLSLTKSSKLSILFWNFFHLIVYSECHSVFVEIFLIFKPFIVLCCGSSEFEHSPVFGYLGCFQYFAISDNAAAKSLVQIFFFCIIGYLQRRWKVLIFQLCEQYCVSDFIMFQVTCLPGLTFTFMVTLQMYSRLWK